MGYNTDHYDGLTDARNSDALYTLSKPRAFMDMYDAEKMALLYSTIRATCYALTADTDRMELLIIDVDAPDAVLARLADCIPKEPLAA